MAEVEKVDKPVNRGRGAGLMSALALRLFLALVTCHSSLLFGFSQVQGALAQVASGSTSSPFALTFSSNPAQGDLVVVFASAGCSSGGLSPITIKDDNSSGAALGAWKTARRRTDVVRARRPHHIFKARSADFVPFEVCGFSRGAARTAESQRQRLRATGCQIFTGSSLAAGVTGVVAPDWAVRVQSAFGTSTSPNPSEEKPP